MIKANSVYPEFRNGQMKWLASDVLSIGGQPQVGNVWYVDPVNGSNTANNGTSWNSAFADLTTAYNAASNNNYDVIVIAPGGTGSGSATSVGSALTWSKNLITVIGAAAPTDVSQRSRILVDDASYSLTISGKGNRFVNLQWATFLDVNVPFTVSGERNYFGSMQIAGMGIQAAGDDTAGRNLVISGGSENLFEGVTFGVDTVNRGAANIGLEFNSAATRNTFRNCKFTMAADATTPVHIGTVGTSALDRWTEFNNCTYYTFYENHSDKIKGTFDVSSQSATADLLLTGAQLFIGTDDVEEVASNILWFEPATSTANAIGLAINNS